MLLLKIVRWFGYTIEDEIDFVLVFNDKTLEGLQEKIEYKHKGYCLTTSTSKKYSFSKTKTTPLGIGSASKFDKVGKFQYAGEFTLHGVRMEYSWITSGGEDEWGYFEVLEEVK